MTDNMQKFMDANYDFSNNIEHKYSLRILDKYEVGDFVFDRHAISISDKLEVNNKFTPSTVKVVFDFNKATLYGGENIDISKVTFEHAILRYKLFNDDELADWKFNESRIYEDIALADLFKLDNNFKVRGIFDSDFYDVFEGVITEVNTSMFNTNAKITVTFKSKMIEAYNKKFLEGKVLTDYYICNNQNQAKSLMHKWAKDMGFNFYDFEDVKYPNGKYIVVPFVEEKKDTQIMSDFAELVRSFNGMMRVDGDKIFSANMSKIVFPINFVMDERNIMQPFNKSEVKPSAKEIKLTFDKYSYGTERIVFALAGENGNTNYSNIKVLKNTNRENQKLRYIVNWQPSGLVQDWHVAEVKAFKVNGAEKPEYVELDYEFIDITNSGGYVKFYNSLDVDIIIEKFIIKGTPVIKSSNNTTSFTKYREEEIGIDDTISKNNKFVQMTDHAKYYTQLYYHKECEVYTEYSFTTNHCLAFMKPGSNVFVRNKVTGSINCMVTEMSHNGNDCQLKCTTYNDFKYIETDDDIIIDSGVSDEDIKTDDIINNGGILTDDIPPAPLDFTLKDEINGFRVTLVKPDDTSIKGFIVYHAVQGTNNWTKEFYGSTQFIINGTPGTWYDVKATCVSFKDKESELTVTKSVKPRALTSGEVIYPPGMTPEELDQARKDLNTIVDNAIAEGDRKYQVLERELVATESELRSTITAEIADFDKNIVQKKFTEIKQTTDEITIVAQRAEGKIDDLSDPTNLISTINVAPEGITITGAKIKLGPSMTIHSDGSVDIGRVNAQQLVIGDNFYADAASGELRIKKVEISEINGLGSKFDEVNNRFDTGLLTINANTTIAGNFKVKGENIELNGNTSLIGTMNIYSNNGFVLWNGSTQGNSNKKMIIKADAIEFWELI
ncbi:MAG: hypothetical protein ACRC23_01630 [Aeromonas jandaei]